MAQIILNENIVPPNTPSAGQVSLYAKADGNLYSKDPLGNERLVTTGSSITSLTGEVTATGPGAAVTTVSNSAVIGKLLIGYTPTTGNILATDTILEGIQKLGYYQHVPATIGTGNGLSILAQAISLQVANSSQPGALSAADWAAFAGKQAPGNYITDLTDDVTATGPGIVVATLKTVNTNVGSFTNASVTVDGKGRITAAASGPSITGNEQYTQASLAASTSWNITHTADASFKRIVQVWKERVYTDISLDFDTADAGNFIQENSAKTDFLSNQLQLKNLGLSNVYAHWMLNEASGSTAADSSGNGHSATTVAAPTWGAGKLNNCLTFNGSTQYATAGVSVCDFERTQAFSLESWVKTSSAGPIMIMTKATGGPTYRGYALYANAGKLIFYIISDNNGGNQLQVQTTSATVNDGNWHHVVTTYSGNSDVSGVKIYIDGSSVALTTVENGLTGTILNAATFTIAARNGATPDSLWNGSLDEMLVYTKELSASEVLFRYNSGAGTESLVSYDTSKGWYVTTGPGSQLNTSVWSDISIVSFTQTTPASTQLRYLVSVDGRTTWKLWTGSAWATETLANIHTNGNTSTQLAAITPTNWAGLFVSGTFDMAFGLLSTANTSTPLLDQITINYDLIGAKKCTDQEILLSVVDSTTTQVTNISAVTIFDLRANIDF